MAPASARRSADGLIAEYRAALERRRAHEEEMLRLSIEHKVARLLAEETERLGTTRLGEGEVRAALKAAGGHYHHAVRILSANDVRDEISRMGRSKVAAMLGDAAGLRSERPHAERLECLRERINQSGHGRRYQRDPYADIGRDRERA